jgi:hypothetical protein
LKIIFYNIFSINTRFLIHLKTYLRILFNISILLLRQSERRKLSWLKSMWLLFFQVFHKMNLLFSECSTCSRNDKIILRAFRFRLVEYKVCIAFWIQVFLFHWFVTFKTCFLYFLVNSFCTWFIFMRLLKNVKILILREFTFSSC